MMSLFTVQLYCVWFQTSHSAIQVPSLLKYFRRAGEQRKLNSRNTDNLRYENKTCAFVHSTRKKVQRDVQIYGVSSPPSHCTVYHAPRRRRTNTLLTTFVVIVPRFFPYFFTVTAYRL